MGQNAPKFSRLRRATEPDQRGGSAVTLAQSFFVLLLGRALQGLGSGCAWCACAVYIAEMAPKEWRGGLVAISDISINVGILLGFAIDRAIILALPREPDLRWRVAMGVSLILPLFYVVAHPFLPESPRWLLMSGRKTEADRVGYDLMAVAGYNPKGIADVFRMLGEGRNDPAWTEVISTHPNPESRVKDIENRLAKDPKRASYPPLKPWPFGKPGAVDRSQEKGAPTRSGGGGGGLVALLYGLDGSRVGCGCYGH